MSRLTYTADMAIDDRTPTHPAAPVHAEHYCEHPGCDRWGSFGFARMAGEQGTWHCAKHYPYWTDEERRRRAALPG